MAPIKIAAFAANHVALLVMREGRPQWYRPGFKSPLYPWMPIFGVLTGIVLLFSLALAVNIGVLLGPYRRRLEALYNAEGERQAMLVETIHGIQTVKALSMEPVQRKITDPQ